MNNNEKAENVSTIEKTDAVSLYLKKQKKKKIITIVSIILIVLLAVASFFKFYKTKNFKVNSVKWDITTEQLKSRCHAEFKEETDEKISYSYSSVEKINGDCTVNYYFSNNKLSYVSIDLLFFSNENIEKLKQNFDMKNISYDGNYYYSEHKGYHLYLLNTDFLSKSDSKHWYLYIKKEKTHDSAIDYPVEDEIAEKATVDEETAAIVTRAKAAALIEPTTISDPDTFRTGYNTYVNAIVEISEAYDKYPDNADVLSAYTALWNKSGTWGNKGIQMLELVDPSEKEEYRTWLLDCLESLKSALNSGNN